MVVYAVMRGTELHMLYIHETAAKRQCRTMNETFPRGKRYTVVPMNLQMHE